MKNRRLPWYPKTIRLRVTFTLGKETVMQAELVKKIQEKSARIAVVGLGRVGLPIAVVFANSGYRVVGVDNNEDVVEALSKPDFSSKEPDIQELTGELTKTGRLEATTDVAKAVKSTNIVIICVQTPLDKSADPDLSYLKKACATVAKSLSPGKLVIIESTVPPGTTRKVVAPILEKESRLKCGEDFWLVHCPERIAPGRAMQELTENARIVGGFDPRSAKIAANLLTNVTKGPVLITDCTTAEVAKLAENTFRDVNIAFANELALICEHIGVDAVEAIKIANTHPRVNIHSAGCGVGGPCLTKDPYLLLHSMGKDFSSKIIASSRKMNDEMPEHVVHSLLKILKETGKNIKELKIAVLGVAYKGQVDDATNSPAKPIVHRLMDLGASVEVYDPYCKETFGAKKASSITSAVKGKDCVLIEADHDAFKNLNLSELKSVMRENPIIVDCRRIIDAAKARKHGFLYAGTGYGSAEIS
jgi:UDP-N-acetyl-D-mannosaminuronic acid dehydrogenase